MKTYMKIIGTLVLFALLYMCIMVFFYNYFYAYPKGYLDIVEREAGALNYVIVKKTSIDKDTTIYFSRSNNGVGNQLHVGTIDSNLPDFIANLSCKETSSVYFPINSYGMLKANDSEGLAYLFGATTDENTVAVQIRFYMPDSDEYVDYDLVYDNHVFYYVGIDEKMAANESRIYGLNEEGGVTFEYSGEGLAPGTFISKEKQS